MRDLGAAPAPQNSFLLNVGMETLALRMQRHYENAQAVAEFLEKHPKITKVNYPGLSSSTRLCTQTKNIYLTVCVVSFPLRLKVAKKPRQKWLNALQMTSREVHVADIRTCALHPATSTHRQLSETELEKAGISAGLYSSLLRY